MQKRECSYSRIPSEEQEAISQFGDGVSPAAIVAALSGNLTNFTAASTPGGIEAQEKAGQIEQSFLETLPVTGTCTATERAMFEALGFKFKHSRQQDQSRGPRELFADVEFPKGWRKRCTSHDMHTDLVDDKGRKRGGIFYKAAFYDQRADVHLTRRFSYCSEPIEGWAGQKADRSGRYHGVVKDSDTIIFETEATEPEPKYDHAVDESQRQPWLNWLAYKDAKAEAAKVWLAGKYPDWENVSAYWD